MYVMVSLQFGVKINCTVKSLLFTNECTSDCLKNYIKMYVKIARTCFGAVTPSSGSSLSVLAKVTLVKIVSYGASVCDWMGGDVAACVGCVLVDVCMLHCFGVDNHLRIRWWIINFDSIKMHGTKKCTVFELKKGWGMDWESITV
jgi:hypothetical protein